MAIPDLFEEKSKHFFPRELYFWVLNTLGWLFTLFLVNPGELLPGNPDEGFSRFVVAGIVWLDHYVLGTLTLLVFRRFYYRQRWYQKRFLGSLPLVLLVSLGGGFTNALLAVLPVALLRGSDFRVYNEAGVAVVDGMLSATRFAGLEYAVLFVVWLLVYLGVEGAVNARQLAFKSLALENSLKDARLNALAGQINPHFLFNALNNIRFMIQRDAARAEESLVDLSEILRHSLGTSQQEKTSLAQELAIVERYLNLMKIQMQRRLEYSIHSPGVPERVLIPPMIIQMLVENAIKHGVEQIREGGRVDIHCSMMAGKLCIEVRNPVVSNEFVKGSGKGLGLENIRTRLSLLYGDNAELVMSRQEGNFLARIVLPQEEGA